MNTDVLKGKWAQIRGDVKQFWGRLTDDDLDRIDGVIDKLSGKLQERYGYSKEKAASEIEKFVKNLRIKIDMGKNK